MDRSEKWKTLMCFALFGCVVIGLCIRLTYLQAVRAEPNRKSVKRARDVYEPLPFARGDIVDRMGKLLAHDRLTLSVRAEFQARVPKGAPRIPDTIMDFLASRLASNLVVGDPERGSRSVLAKKLGKRMRIAPHKLMPSKFRTVDYLSVDFLVCGDLDSHESVRRLRLEANLWRSKKKMPGRLHLSITKNYTRTYPDRESTFGPVGNHYIAERKAKTASGLTRTVRYEDYVGLESCSVLWPEKPALRALSRPHQLDFKDSRRRRFWTGLGVDPRMPSRLHCTIDLELQKAAHAELRVAAKAVTDHYKSSFEWGAIVLVDLELGDILAMASHYPGRKGVTPFAPVENAFEPGSVVKPLVIGYALEQGKVGWHDSIDCTPTRSRNGRPVDGHPGRTIRDDHRCGVLTTREVIVQSSNIGAVKIGTRLGRSGMRDYLRHYDRHRSAQGDPRAWSGGRYRSTARDAGTEVRSLHRPVSQFRLRTQRHRRAAGPRLSPVVVRSRAGAPARQRGGDRLQDGARALRRQAANGVLVGRYGREDPGCDGWGGLGRAPRHRSSPLQDDQGSGACPTAHGGQDRDLGFSDRWNCEEDRCFRRVRARRQASVSRRVCSSEGSCWAILRRELCCPTSWPTASRRLGVAAEKPVAPFQAGQSMERGSG